jgi:hypothetical protein
MAMIARIVMHCLLLMAPAENPEIVQALAGAGENRAELERALRDSTAEERPGMEFLVANMPEGDRKTLKADYLLENTRLAYRARRETPWGKSIPEELFLNDVLPYAHVDESRDPWRREFFDLCLPMVKGCKTPEEAARKLNAELFGKLKVKYSTKRRAPNQSAKETLETGVASCTGLSIVLADACRAVCIPARLAGTPLWANKRGNHTWVEVWDKDWHFTGACEQDPKGLDRGWFVGDAAQARKDVFEHAIYAASFKRSKVWFPMVWAMGNHQVPGENVTDRYAKKPVAPAGTVRLLVRVVDASGKRVARPVNVTSAKDGTLKKQETSRGETNDLNDIAGFDLPRDTEVDIAVEGTRKTVRTSAVDKEQLVEIRLGV